MSTTTVRNISAQQKPLQTGFTAATTSQEIMKGVDLNGKIAIVTGGYSGIGLETVRSLAKAGAKVIVPVRSTISEEIFSEYAGNVEVASMDLLNPASIDSFSAQFLASGRPLHLLINNAGIMANPLYRDARGFESQFATNHLGHYQLTIRLWDALKKANGARVVNLSSLGHRFSDIIYSDPNFETTPYDKWRAYGQSKTANILFSLYLDKAGKELDIRSYAVHPGRIIDTNLKKYMSQEELIRMGALDADGNINKNNGSFYKTIEQGAATTLFCATSQLLNNIGGVYCEDNDVSAVVDETADIIKMTNGVLPYAVDFNNAEKLWDLSYELTGVTL